MSKTSVALAALSMMLVVASGCSKKSKAEASATTSGKTATTSQETKGAKAEKAAEAKKDAVDAVCEKAYSVKCDSGFMGKDAAECKKLFRERIGKWSKCKEPMMKHLACMAEKMQPACEKQEDGKTQFSIKNEDGLCSAEEKAVDKCMETNHYEK